MTIIYNKLNIIYVVMVFELHFFLPILQSVYLFYVVAGVLKDGGGNVYGPASNGAAAASGFPTQFVSSTMLAVLFLEVLLK